MNLLSATAFMVRRRRWLQCMFLVAPIVNLAASIVCRAPHVIIVCNVSISLSAFALMVRVWRWPAVVAGVCAVAVIAYSGAHDEVGMLCLGTFDWGIAMVCYWLCERWRKAYSLARILLVMPPIQAAEEFHGVAPGQSGSFRQLLLQTGVPASTVACVEELCEEKLTVAELVDLRSKLENRSGDS